MENVFSERLSQIRREKKLTQKAAAELIGIQAASLSSYESGRKSPNLEIAEKIAKAYGCSLDWLCGIEDVRKSDSVSGGVTKADVFKAFTSLCESGIQVEFGTNWMTNSRNTHVDLRIVNCDWLAQMIDTYRKLHELYKTRELSSEVLNAWKDKKLAELDKPIDDDELPY